MAELEQVTPEDTEAIATELENSVPASAKDVVVELKPEPELEKERQEIAAERKQMTETLRKVNNQIEAQKRLESKFIQREAQLVERERELQNLTSVQNITAFLAKQRGVSVDEIWTEWADEIKNGGKPSEATIAKRERDALKREREEEKAKREQLEQSHQQEIQTRWGNEMDEILTGESFKTAYPRLSQAPRKIVVDAILKNVVEYQRQTGALPDHSAMLKFLEEQCPEAAPLPAPATTAKKPLPSARDAATPPTRRALTDAEREDDAIAFVSKLE